MSSPSAGRSPGSRWLPAARWLATWCLAFILILTLQWSSGATRAAFGGAADEPAHYIGGLLVHDYLRAGLPGHPLAFARDYYAHLPYFAIGVWPPLFYLIEGLWMLLAGTSKGAALTLVALCSAALAATLYHGMRERYGDLAAAAAAALLLLLPGQQWVQCYIMADTATALLAWLAILRLARFLEGRRLTDSLLFGGLAAAALLTKHSAWYLALVPLPALAVGRAWGLARRPALWASAAVVGMLELPWLLFAGRNTFVNFDEMGKSGLLAGLADYTTTLSSTLSWLIVVSTAGAVLVFVKGRQLPAALWCAAVTVPAVGVSIVFARVPLQVRLMTVAYAAALMLAAEALLWAGRRRGRLLAACGLALALLLVARRHWLVFEHPPTNHLRAVVEFLHGHEAGGPPGSLLAPSQHEGRWIAEFALREERPGRILLRAGKLLGQENWLGEPKSGPGGAPAAGFLTRVPCRYVVLENSVVTPYDADLTRVISTHPERWTVLYRGPDFLLYENTSWTPEAETRVLAAARSQLTRSLD